MSPLLSRHVLWQEVRLATYLVLLAGLLAEAELRSSVKTCTVIV